MLSLKLSDLIKRLKPKTLQILALWRTALYHHYTAPIQVQFKSLKFGFIFFAIGLGSILFANASMPPSLKQELIVAFGLIIGGLGFFLAMKAYIRIVISRLVIFFQKK